MLIDLKKTFRNVEKNMLVNLKNVHGFENGPWNQKIFVGKYWQIRKIFMDLKNIHWFESVNRFGNIIYLDHLQQEEYAQVLDLTFAKFFENMNLPEELEPIVKQNYSTKKAELVKNYNLSFGARNSESAINDIIVQALQNY